MYIFRFNKNVSTLLVVINLDNLSQNFIVF